MRKFIPYSIAIMTIVGTFFLFRYNREYAIHPYESEWAKDSIAFSALNYKLNIESMGLSIPANVILHTGDTLLNWAKRLERPVLIFRFCEDHCGICVDNELYMLKNYMDDCLSNIVFFTSYSNELFPKIKTIKKFREVVYNIDRGAFDWKIEGYNSPYYFILYPDGKVSNFYLSDKAYPNMGRDYLLGIRKVLL